MEDEQQPRKKQRRTWTPEQRESRRKYRRRYYVAHREEILEKPYHRNVKACGRYVCPVCGRTDTADGSERAESGLCLDCWCARENRKSDKYLRRRIREILGRGDGEDADCRRVARMELAAEAMVRAIEDGATKRAAEKWRRDCRRDEYLHRPEVVERRNALARARYAAKPTPEERRERKLRTQRRYYLAHREEINRKQRERLAAMTPEQKAKRAEYYRRWTEARKNRQQGDENGTR